MQISRRQMMLGGAGMTAGALGGCSIPEFIVDSILPSAPPYPTRDDLRALDMEAQRISNALSTFIDRWLDGIGPAEIPDELLPNGIDPAFAQQLRLVQPEAIRPTQQWVIRKATYTLNQDEGAGLYPDPHCTYIVPGIFFLPFGAKAIIEGKFPRCRFFSIQVTPSFDPNYYYYGGAFGCPEVPIVDVDIEPLPGHLNPFRAGASRLSARRRYRVELEMARGFAPEIEAAYQPPNYRAAGNRRKGSGIMYQGPLAAPGSRLGHGRGVWDAGSLWIRYYAPDRSVGPLGGVPLPKMHFETAAGRRFFITSDLSAKDRVFNKIISIPRSLPKEPDTNLAEPDVAWYRELGIFHTGVSALFQVSGKRSAEDKAQGRALVAGFTRRDAQLPAPANWQCSASRVPYISYLSGGGSIGESKVLVLTGRLPRHPRTLEGNSTMESGQVRYFSITSYAVANFLEAEAAGQPLTSLMDEEILVDAEGRYVICYGHPETRPSNADEANGVTWVNWGPVGEANFNLRWLTVDGDWKDHAITPDDDNVSYAQASWLDPGFDRSLVGLNGRSSIMGDYLPKIQYFTVAKFEELSLQEIRRQAG